MQRSRSLRLSALLLAAAACLAGAGPASALNPVVEKLAKAAEPPAAGLDFAEAVAANERWILAGEPGNGETAAFAGAVHVFDARTGRYLRTLRASDGAESDNFGASVAVHGELAAVGARGRNGSRGAVYLFDLRSGAELRKIAPPGLAANDRLGGSVALGPGLLAAGADGDDQVANAAGAVHVFDPADGTALAKLTAADGGGFHFLGLDVALSGDIVAAGAPNAPGGGAVYLFNGRTGVPLGKLTPPAPNGGDRFGDALAMDGHKLLAGAPMGDGIAPDSGVAHLFDIRGGGLLQSFAPADGQSFDEFGRSVALRDGLVLAGAPAHDGGTGAGAAYFFDAGSGDPLAKHAPFDSPSGADLGAAVALGPGFAVTGAPSELFPQGGTGSAYVVRGVAGRMPLRFVAKSRDFAPGAPDADFGALGQAFLNGDGGVAFGARLVGPGSGSGRDTGVWKTAAAANRVELALKSRASLAALGGSFGGLNAARVTPLSLNSGPRGLLRATLSGPGVSAASNQVLLLAGAGNSLDSLLRSGDARPELGGAAVSRVLGTAQSIAPGGSDHAGIAYQLRRQAGLVRADNDSGVALTLLDTPGDLEDVGAREKEDAGGGFEFRQFAPRVAASHAEIAFAAFLSDGGGPLHALLSKAPLGFAVHHALQGDLAPGAGGLAYRTFLGESISRGDAPIYRATLAGAPAASNEGIWHAAFPLQPVARKGGPHPLLGPGVAWTRFLGFWPVQDDRTLVFARVRGAGVNARNDLGLWLLQEDGSLAELLREGQTTGDTDGSRVNVIQRVDVDPVSGNYLVLASVTGPAARNQALFSGSAGAGDAADGQALRRAAMVLRKGSARQSAAGGLSTVRGLLFTPASDAAGAGGKGLGQTVNAAGEIAVTVEFESRSRQIMAGRP